MLKILAIIIFFYILALLQTSFLIHFNIFTGGIVSYSLFLIPVILITLFTPEKHFYALSAAFSAGLFLDIFSDRPIGVSILILVLIVVFINFILKKHVSPSIRLDPRP